MGMLLGGQTISGAFLGGQRIAGAYLGGQKVWPAPAEVIGQAATGGIETVIDVGGTYYRVHTFNTSGTLTVNSAIEVAEYLIVGGGGEGGASTGNTTGGGGAGGYLAGTLSLGVAAYPAVVGAGAPGCLALSSSPVLGGDNSEAFGLIAYGGGRGGTSDGAGGSAKGGGSGGGAAAWNPSAFGVAVSGQGHNGGSGQSNAASGGGGGAGGVGSSAYTSTPLSSAGAGIVNSISGMAVEYSKGGAGWRNSYGYNTAIDGDTPGTGGGGLYNSNANTSVYSGAGADGIVILRYEITQSEYEAAQ